jgi:hypothetical protein
MDENRRLWVLSGTVVVIVLVVLGGYLAFRGSPEHNVSVRSVPNDLTLTLDGKPVAANGDLKVKEGKHTLTGERRGFESYTQTVDVRGDTQVKMYLFSNSEAGRQWEKGHPDQVLEAEEEASRKYQERTDRLTQNYPILQELPYVGPGFTVNYGASKADPTNPEKLAFYIKITFADGKKASMDWLVGHGYDPSKLELIYTK